MSNKTQLQTNNTALDALITRVNAAKDVAASLPESGGGGGGGSMETCTVTITIGLSGGIPGYVAYTSVHNNEVVAYNKMFDESTSIEIICLCGSMLVVNETYTRVSHTYENLQEIANNASGVSHLGNPTIRTFQVTAPANGTASLRIETDGGV